MTDMMRAADVLARRLYAAGCRRAFGMPGGEVLTLIDALTSAGIEFILCKHENAAGFMAEGAHHVDGAPAILVATVGPGAMNGVNVVANAEQDRVPLIVLTGCVDADDAHRYTHQVLDQRAVFAPITKATFTLSAGAADVITDKALAVALEGRAGPVHIDVPISVAAAPSQDRGMARVVPAPLIPADMALYRDWLARSERPLMVIGLDAVREGCAAEIQAFAERFGVPCVTTYKAKGVLPEDHPLCLGGAGLSPLNDSHILPLLAQADMILCAGYDPIEMRPGWQDPWDPARQNVLDITHAPNLHYMHHATASVVGSIADTLAALADGAPRATWPDGAPAAVRAANAAAFAAPAWGPGAAMEEARAVLPAGTIATVDSGAHRILLSQVWACDGPRQLLQSTGLCTMGCALPLAMGAKIAAPETPVVAFMGDAGFLMTTGELSTAAELNLPVIFVVFVDAQLSLIEKKQRGMQLPNAGVDFGWHDFAAIGRAFGGQGVSVSDRAEMRAAMQEAMQADTFTVIAVQIERQAYDGRI